MLELLERLARERDACILFSTHITQDVEKIASRMLFLVDGALRLDADMKALEERFVKLRLDAAGALPERVGQRGVILSDRFIIMESADAADLAGWERLPLRMEDVLIYLEGGVRGAVRAVPAPQLTFQTPECMIWTARGSLLKGAVL